MKRIYIMFLIVCMLFVSGCTKQKSNIEDNEDVLNYLISTYSSDTSMNKPKVILDTDMTFLGDDAFCLSILVQADNAGLIELMGITVTGGNSFVSVGTNAALRQLELLGRSDIPVYMGTDEPIGGFRNLEEQSKIVGSIDRWGAMTKLDSYVAPENYHDLGKYYERKWGYSETVPQSETAIDFLINSVAENKGEIVLVSIGSPISIALASRQSNDFAENVKSIIYLGGIVEGKGTYTPYADFNCFYDATAFKLCLNANFPRQIVIPQDATENIKINKAVYDLLATKGTTQVSAFWIDNQASLYGRDVNRKDSCDDAIAAVVLLIPDIVTEYQNASVDIIDDEQSAEYGKLIFNEIDEEKNISLVMELDVNRYWNFVTDLLCDVSQEPNVFYNDGVVLDK